MKHILLFLSILLMQLPLFSQPLPKPMPDNMFLQELNRLKNVRPDHKRLTIACDLVRRNSILTVQAKQVARLFNDEFSRLEYMQCVYHAIYDKENIYDLYDVFSAFSTVMRFHDFMEAEDSRREYPGKSKGRAHSFPEYNYPSYKDYRDYRLCDRPMSDDEFEDIIVEIFSYRDDETRVRAAIKIAETNCMSVSQIMKLGSIIEKDQKRLEYMKRSYDYAYDVDNFSYGNQLFREKTYLNEFENYVSERRSSRNRDKRYDNYCRVSDMEMNEIVASLKQQSFENTRLETAKQVIRAKKCFTVIQIRQILETFTFENTRLELAKFCYAYCIDRNDYYRLNTLFTFSRSVDELNKYIAGQN